MNNTLIITDRMLSNAKTNKSVGWLFMNPLDFLRLTTQTTNVLDWIEQEVASTQNLFKYNKYAALGKSVQMPWLDLDRFIGKVCGHEGRHRAAAVYKAGGRKLPVGLCLRERGYAVYYDTPADPTDEYSLRKQFVTKEDVPKVLLGQFNNREVAIDTGSLTEFWADRNR